MGVYHAIERVMPFNWSSGFIFPLGFPLSLLQHTNLAQWTEQRPSKSQVIGSNPIIGNE